MNPSSYPTCPVSVTDLSVPLAVLDAGDSAYPVVWINTAMVAFTGMRWSELVGRPAAAFVGVATSTTALSEVTADLRAGTVATHILRVYRRDGTPLWCEMTFVPARDARGHLTYWVVALRDASPRLAASAQRAVTEAELCRATADLAAFATASEVADEVDNPHMLVEVEKILTATLTPFARFVLCTSSPFLAMRLDLAGIDVCQRQVSQDPVAELVRDAQTLPRWIRFQEVDPHRQPVTAALVEVIRGEVPPALDQVRVSQLVAGGHVLGLLVDAPRSHAPADAKAIDLIGRRIAAALDNAATLARERSMATVLQAAMLPKRVHRADLDVWTYYAPSSEHSQVGGDWYDVASVGPDVVAAVVGDAVGADVEAAAAMGQYRSIVRACGMELVDPAAVLERSDAVAAAMRIPRAAAVVYASFFREQLVGADDTQTAWSMFYARAGHLPPLLLRGARVHVLEGAGAHMLGFGSGPRPQAEVALEPGDVIVMYTDGLIERRERPLKAGMFALVNALAQCHGEASEVGEELVARLVVDQRDDVAVVVVRIPRAGEVVDEQRQRVRSQRWSLPSEPGAVPRARHHGARVCSEWAVARAGDVELVISELVANAVEHGGGGIRLRIFEVPQGVRVEVEDGNPAPPLVVDGHHHGPGGIGMRFVAQLATWGWQPTMEGKLVWAVIDSATG